MHGGLAETFRFKAKLAAIRRLLDVAQPKPIPADTPPDEAVPTTPATTPPCPCCGGRMRIIEVLPDPRRRRLRFDSS